MAFTNSSLVNYTRISPNRGNVVNGKRVYGRDHAIDTVSIHCVVGQCTVEALGSIFASASKQASSNYGIGYDGRIGMYVEEKDRSWCTSSRANDNRAVTIEVASDTKHPYRVNDAAYKSLIKLLADICRRNGIKKLVWSTDKNNRINHRNGCNMTVHRDFANKACPGDYLYNLHGQIADEVNKILSQEDDDNMIRYQKLADVPAGDYRNAVQKGMDALMKGRTVFVIAHRLSTIRNADVIMVLDHGRIIERGTHKKLIEEKGQYYQLYTGAFELE